MRQPKPSRREFLQGSSALAISCTFGFCGRFARARAPTNNRPRDGFRQAISSWRHETAEAARDVLLKGGNAIDAAVASLLVLCVVDPANVSLGGYGGSMVAYHAPSRRVRAINSDTRAPRKFDPAFFNERDANYRYMAVGVPGVVSGIDLALREYGTLPFNVLAKYALALAEQGIEVSPSLASAFRELARELDLTSRRAYFPNGVPDTSTIWVQADLAKLIRRLAEEGPASFYGGEVASRIARQVRANGGTLSADDFQDFQAAGDEPLHVNYRGYDLFYTPPPPSGGLTSLSILKTLEQFDLSRLEPWGAEYVELFAGASNLAWGERYKYLGDPDFVNVPVEDLLSENRAAARAKSLRNGVPSISSRSHDPLHTVNFVVVDRNQNVVSWTATHGGSFGSRVAIEGLGLLMGNGMSRFAFKSPAPNYPVGGKRPQHNMSPLVVLRDGKPCAALGMPGGRMIVTGTAQMVVNLIDFNATPQRVVSSPRVHTEGEEPIQVSDLSPAVVDELRKRGHKVNVVPYLGGESNAAVIDLKTGCVEAAASGKPPGVLTF